MSTLQSIEDQIVSEYGKIKGWIMTHVYLSIAGACAVFWILGRVGFPF